MGKDKGCRVVPFFCMKAGIDYIGVNVAFVCHDGRGRILMQRRGENCRDEQGRWDCGGGQVTHGEELNAALAREVREEYGATVKDSVFLNVRNVLRSDNGIATHWVSIRFLVLVDPSEVSNAEPQKMDYIDWFTIDTMPQPLHTALVDDISVIREALAAYASTH